MSVSKANRFIEIAKQNGWETAWNIHNREEENVVVVATRKAESIQIEWANNQLSYSPKYKFHEMERKIHSRKDAEKILRRMKPDLDQYHRFQRSSGNASISVGGAQERPSETEYTLPFDPDLDDDSTILKRIRGNTIIFRNNLTGEVESVIVPWKVSGGKNGIRVMNVDLTNVFYLATSESGRDYLSFMDMEGRFRAVHLDRLIGVV